MVEHRPKRVVRILGSGGDLHGLRDRDPETPGLVRRLRAAGFRQIGGAAMDRPAPGLDHRLAVGLLVVGDADHEDLAVEPEELTGERQRRAPLPRPGLCGELPDARLAVVERLGDGRVRLVGAGRRDPLVLVVDVGGRLELPLQAARPQQGRRPPEAVDVADLIGDLDVRVGRDLLGDQAHGEDRGEVVGPDRVAGGRAEGRWRRIAGQVGEQVHPAGRDLLLGELELHLIAHGRAILCVLGGSSAKPGAP